MKTAEQIKKSIDTRIAMGMARGAEPVSITAACAQEIHAQFSALEAQIAFVNDLAAREIKALKAQLAAVSP